ncbi:hypothetical protein BKA62DRAFT_649965 [Auriculariales sp. MPI-PUGE-AT-0066]|nr:hypothetical protein BKA62DRAFT_649965 [Auriculariales sp. MPI-PUGE-AT-0066]
MSQPLLTLRPPANVDWIQGYPGIPPSAQDDRTHAAVRGTVEVRPTQQLKAKWLRIELRKVETLPANAGIFYDHVGQSPLTLWQSEGDEFSILQACDYPFNIRIPESIPPTLNLGKDAGIRYELVASVCVKAKKGLFPLRKDSTSIQNVSANIVIDKHELHATWPIYSQPDSRQVQNGGVVLIVNRSATCYGPGDRVSVGVTVKSDDLSACVLRTIEFVLRETIVLRAGPHGAGKKNGPQSRISSVGEHRSNANVTLYGGTQFRAELACSIPPEHLTATVNTARHIDVSYFMYVRAVLDNGKVLEINMPVTLSNWPRTISSEAVRRIGPAPNLSAHALLPAPDQSSTTQTLSQYATAPSTSSTSSATTGVDHLGRLTQRPSAQTVSGRSGRGSSIDLTSTSRLQQPASPSIPHATEQADALGPLRSSNNTNPTRPRTGSSVASPRTRTIDLLAGEDGSANAATAVDQSAAPPGSNSPAPRVWLSAEDEKKRLYDEAKSSAERTQSRLTNATTAGSGSSQSRPVPAPAQNDQRTGSSPWVTAEHEKARLYHEAQDNVARAQTTGVVRQAQDSRSPNSTTPQPANSANRATAEALYQQALANMPAASSAAASPTSSPRPKTPPSSSSRPKSPQVSSSSSRPKSPQTLSNIQQYPSAIEEKAAYEQARRAVERHQSSNISGSSAPRSDTSRGAAFAGLSQPEIDVAASEKERLRQEFAARDAAALSRMTARTPQPGHRKDSASASSSGHDRQSSFVGRSAASSSSAAALLDLTSPTSSSHGHSAMSSADISSAAAEKERMRQEFAARDAAALARVTARTPVGHRRDSNTSSSGHARQTSLVVHNATPSLSSPRSHPTSIPELMPSPSQAEINSAAAEKERLRRAFAERDAALNAPKRNPAYDTPPVSTTSSQFHASQSSQIGQSIEPAIQNGHIGHGGKEPRRPTTGGSIVEPRDPTIKQGKQREIHVGPPPPLAPRPPADYLEETIRRDTRSQEWFSQVQLPPSEGEGPNRPPLPPKVPVYQ